MYPIHDTDAQLLLATLIAAKRRPAALTDIVAAAEFMGFPVTAPGAWATVLDCLCERFPAVPRAAWLDRMARGRGSARGREAAGRNGAG